MSNVRSQSGVPPVAAFGGADGTPIVVDADTGQGYTLKSGDVVVPMGTVTSVGLTGPSGLLTVSGSPATSSSSLALAWGAPLYSIPYASATNALGATSSFRFDGNILFVANRQAITDDGAALSSGAIPVATASNRIKDSGFTTTNLVADKYLPVITAPVNLDATASPTTSNYSRLGAVVTASGRFSADPTLTATTTSFEMSLPVASDIGQVHEISGVAFCGAISGQGAEIFGSTANNTAVVSWRSSDITNQTWSYVYAYRVI